MRLPKLTRLAAPLLLVAITAGCDTDLYFDTTACRDDDANTVCPIDGSRDGPQASNGSDLANRAE